MSDLQTEIKEEGVAWRLPPKIGSAYYYFKAFNL